MPDSVVTAAFDQAPLAMAVLEAQAPFRVLAANAAFVTDVAAGLPVQQLQRLGLGEILADDAAEATLIMVGRVAEDHAPRTSLEYRAAERRFWEVRASCIDYGGTPALLYVGADATTRKQQHRRMEEAGDRLTAITNFTAAGLLDPDRLTEAFVEMAAAVSHGPAAVYGGADGAPLRRITARGLPIDHRAVMPEVLTPERFAVVRSTLASGCSRVIPYSPAMPYDERTLLRGMHWLAIVPVRTRQRTTGVLLAAARGRAPGLRRGDLQLLEWCAGQLGFAIEHADLF